MLWAPFHLSCLRWTKVKGDTMGSISLTVCRVTLVRGGVMSSISYSLFESD